MGNNSKAAVRRSLLSFIRDEDAHSLVDVLDLITRRGVRPSAVDERSTPTTEARASTSIPPEGRETP